MSDPNYTPPTKGQVKSFHRRQAHYAAVRTKEEMMAHAPAFANLDYQNWRMIWLAIRHAMIGEESRIARHIDRTRVEDLACLHLAALPPAKHISQPTGFLAFHHQFIPLRYRAKQENLSCRSTRINTSGPQR